MIRPGHGKVAAEGAVRAQPGMVRMLAAAALLTPPAASAVVLVALLSSPESHPLGRSLSVLGEPGAPLALAVNGSFAALGLSLLALGFGLDRTVAGAHRAGILLLVVAGASLVGVALVARDPSRPQLIAVHRLIAVLAFASLGLAPLFLVRRLRADVAWRAHAWASLGFGSASLALLMVAVLLFAAGRLRAGVWETAFAASSIVWLMIMAGRLALTAWRRQPATPTPSQGPRSAA